MALAPYMHAPRCDCVLQDETLLECLAHKPNTARNLARFLQQPISEVLARLKRLESMRLVSRTDDGLWQR